MSNPATLKNIRDLDKAPARKTAATAKLSGVLPSGDKCSSAILEMTIVDDLSLLEADWCELEKHSNISIYQRYDWVEACLNTLESKLQAKPQIVSGRKNGKLVFVLPLVSQGEIMPMTRWIGGNHSNFNLALIDNGFRKTLSIDDVHALFLQISELLPNNGYLKLCCQPLVWQGQSNPLQAVSHQRSTNVALGMDLSGGFEDVLASVNGKRKRKKFRSQTRALKSLGGAKLVEATSAKETLAILNSFYLQKSERLRNQGLKDVFGGSDTKAFLEKIAVDSLGSNQPLLILFALEIDGKYRAICGGGVADKHFSAYFTSFSDDEFAHISPGEMLLYLMVENLCESGFLSLDLGCGEERYKRSWCTQTHEMFDIIEPLSPVSRGNVLAQRLLLVIKRTVRENQHLWNYFKRMRVVGAKIADIFKHK